MTTPSNNADNLRVVNLKTPILPPIAQLLVFLQCETANSTQRPRGSYFDEAGQEIYRHYLEILLA
jgi:hypothetical protein